MISVRLPISGTMIHSITPSITELAMTEDADKFLDETVKG